MPPVDDIKVKICTNDAQSGCKHKVKNIIIFSFSAVCNKRIFFHSILISELFETHSFYNVMCHLVASCSPPSSTSSSLPVATAVLSIFAIARRFRSLRHAGERESERDLERENRNESGPCNSICALISRAKRFAIEFIATVSFVSMRASLCLHECCISIRVFRVSPKEN